MQARELLVESFYAALRAADPLNLVAPHLPARTAIPDGARVFVVGAGKAAASMAAAVEAAWPDLPLEGVVVTRYGHGMPTSRIRVVEASHPVPDAAGESAARDILATVERASSNDLVIALIAGGGSALLSLPAEGISSDELRAVTSALLRSGAPIGDINCVRKHLSRISGGRLAKGCRGRMLALAISDVAGDELSAIASGPTVPDPTTFADAIAVLDRWNVVPPEPVRAHLAAGTRGEREETPKVGDPCFERVETQLIATASAMLAAAVAFWREAGFEPVLLGEVEGEAKDVARAHAMLVSQRIGALSVDADARATVPGASTSSAAHRPIAIVSGGECTVTVRGRGKGGRCTEYLIQLLLALDDLGVRADAIACDTDGIDGSEDNAGAVLLSDTLDRAHRKDVDPRTYAANNDAYSFFEALGDLVVSGPTRTNVNDYRAILVGLK